MARLLLLVTFICSSLGCGNCSPKKLVHISPELAEKVLLAVQKCQPETGIDGNALLMIYDGKYCEDQQFKDFVFCSYKTTGFLKKDGYLNEEKAIKAFKNEHLVEDGIRRCGPLRGNGPKESLFMFFKCFIDTTPVQITI